MSIDYAILGVLTSGSATGYEIKAEFDEEVQGLIWGVSQGSVYTRLRQLSQKGWIREIQAEAEGRQRRYYELTLQGWKALMAWQSEPSDYPVVKDDLLLKMAFWANPEQRTNLVEQLQVRRARSRKLLQVFQDLPTNQESVVGEYGLLVSKYVCAKLQAELDWLEMAISQLEGPPQAPAQDPYGAVEARLEYVQKVVLPKLREPSPSPEASMSPTQRDTKGTINEK